MTRALAALPSYPNHRAKITRLLRVSSWVTKHFAAKTRDELECLATVDFAMQSLLAKRVAASIETVKADIASDPVWKPKLTKPHFSNDKIGASIAFLAKLFHEGS